MSAPSSSSAPAKRKKGVGAVKTMSASTSSQPAPDKRKKGDDLVTIDDFMAKKQNPFEAEFCGSDVVLIVEGKRLHTHRALLSIYCHYFNVLFGSKNFAEANANQIELKESEHVEMKYSAVVAFLKHLYPVHSFTAISDDKALTGLFLLAEYFQCRHVRQKCESYIQSQLERPERELLVPSLLLYLRLCSQFRADQFNDRLLDILSKKELHSIRNDRLFKLLTPEIQSDILHRRVDYVESTAKQFFKDNRSVLSSFQRSLDPRECRVCQRKAGFSDHSCSDCFIKFQGDLGFS